MIKTVGAVAALLLLALGAFLPSLEIVRDPLWRYRLEWLGFGDFYRSGWFIVATGVFALGCLAEAVRRGYAEWRLLREGRIQPLSLKSGPRGSAAKGDRPVLYVRLASAIGREDFRDAARDVCAKIGPMRRLRDEGGLNELQLCAEQGRFSELAFALAPLGLLAAILGVVLGELRGFEGRMQVDEGSRASVVQAVRGAEPAWPPHREAGLAVPGFYQPGFSLALESLELDERGKPRARLSFQQANPAHPGQPAHAEAPRIAEPGRPATFKVRGLQAGPASGTGVPMDFHLLSQGRARAAGARLVVSDRLGDEPDRDVELELGGAEQALSGARVRLLDVRDAPEEELGPSAQLEYREGDGAPQRFWIFQKRPEYDSAHRKRSHFLFALRSVTLKRQLVLSVTRDPGWPWVAGGLAWGLIALAVGLFTHPHRLHFIWEPGFITVAGVSRRPFLLRPRFAAVAEQARRRLARTDKALKSARAEVQHGWV